ncbi:hypothetical protein [Bacillus mobilis]|uniref:hypothetical protein n=1 Tax=Bacillus mobilis TaxID=2026190 RepID=UPI002E218FB6|nr:hypothetical protein [Bacillus mobilis]MED0956303.1 hypothetical protein [Bacillus mobilis]
MEFLKDTEAIGYIVMGVSRMGYGLDVIFQAMDVAQLVLNQKLKEELWNEDVLEVVEKLGHEIEINEDELRSELYWGFDVHTENEAGIIYEKFMDLRKSESKLTR